MIYPEFPKEGDTIGICAPSFGVGHKLEWFDLSMETLEESGFNLVETDSVRNEAFPSAPAEIRGAEFNSLFDDDNINMVMSASGGDYNIEMIPFIDQELVKANPKWFVGYSDPTSIEMLLTTVLDIATIYGVNAGSWDWRPLNKFQYDALSVIKGELPVQTSYEMWACENFDEEDSEHEMNTPVEWTLLRGNGEELVEENELDVSGRLIGGCIDVIDWVIGTPFEDLTGFCERYKDDGFIWFFDNYDLNPMALMYIARKMRNMGLFDHAKAVIFGRTCFPGDATDIDYLEQLERVFADIDVPLIWGADIGHTRPSFTLINGAIGHFRFEDGNAELTMELK
jgi:muramoyltetrapeptide carboxypeptidase LdcA involved in peptidoglycan recycling